MDLFEWEKHTYLLIVDYYSRWIEIVCLGHAVVQHTKAIFAHYGVPDEVVSDNEPQNASECLCQFR